MTLKEMIEQHPEWADLPVAVMSVCGDLDYIDCSGTAFVGEDFADDVEAIEGTGDPVLVFAGN